MSFLWMVLRHKWYVLSAGIKLGGIPLRNLIIHDLSKFSRIEWAGQKARGGDDNRLGYDKTVWGNAWIHHKNHNNHHWEYWRLDGNIRDGFYPDDYCINGFVPMPNRCVREMVADMMGASKEYTGFWNFQKFLNDNYHRFILHPKTEKYFQKVLSEIGVRLP